MTISRIIKAARVLLLLAIILVARPVRSEVKLTPIHVFGSPKCRSCVEAKAYLEFAAREGKAAVIFHDVSSSAEAAALAKAVARELGLSVSDFPLVVIGDSGFVGWSGEALGPKATADIRAIESRPADDVVAAVQAELAAKAEAGDEKDGNDGIGLFFPAVIVCSVVFVAAVATNVRRRGKAALP
jgi:glutaredoxin